MKKDKNKDKNIVKQCPCLLAFCVVVGFFSAALAEEKYDLWPNLAPGETVREANVEPNGDHASRVTTPQLLVFKPEKKTSDACVLVFPGGGYDVCFYYNEGIPIARWWNEKGVTACVLVYRVPRPAGKPIYASAWQDAQRAVRWTRSHAKSLGIHPEKIGAQGFSAGGHLTLMTALNSQTAAYEPTDELDKVPCHVNFAIPVYPAYVLEDGAEGPNQNQGNGVKMLPTFLFDTRTPPMCLLHGDSDIYSPVGSISVYQELRKKKVPCELHIFSGAVHGFMFWDNAANTQTWKDRCWAWFQTLGL